MGGYGRPLPSRLHPLVTVLGFVAYAYVWVQAAGSGAAPVWGAWVGVLAPVAGWLAVALLPVMRVSKQNRAVARWVRSPRGLTAVLAGSALSWTVTPKGEGAKPQAWIPKVARPVEVARGVKVAIQAIPGRTEEDYRALVDAMVPTLPVGVAGVEYLASAQGWHFFLLVTADPLANVGEAEL